VDLLIAAGGSRSCPWRNSCFGVRPEQSQCHAVGPLGLWEACGHAERYYRISRKPIFRRTRWSYLLRMPFEAQWPTNYCAGERTRFSTPRGGGDHRAGEPAPLSVWSVYRGLRPILVFRKRLMGILYDHSIPAVIAFCVIAELAAIPAYQGEWIQACCCHIEKSTHRSYARISQMQLCDRGPGLRHQLRAGCDDAVQFFQDFCPSLYVAP
jgi:hypothetical protein